MTKVMDFTMEKRERKQEIKRLICEINRAASTSRKLGLKIPHYYYYGTVSIVGDLVNMLALLFAVTCVLCMTVDATIGAIQGTRIDAAHAIFLIGILFFVVKYMVLDQYKNMRDPYVNKWSYNIPNTPEGLQRLQAGWAYWQSEISRAESRMAEYEERIAQFRTYAERLAENPEASVGVSEKANDCAVKINLQASFNLFDEQEAQVARQILESYLSLLPDDNSSCEN